MLARAHADHRRRLPAPRHGHREGGVLRAGEREPHRERRQGRRARVSSVSRSRSPKYFWGRLSATSPAAYNAAPRRHEPRAHEPGAPKRPRRVDALAPLSPDKHALVPVDLVTASASGLDPAHHAGGGALSGPRVARARGIGEERVRDLVARAYARAARSASRRAARQRLLYCAEPGRSMRRARAIMRRGAELRPGRTPESRRAASTALQAEERRAKRGRLTIFFGAAPGVGKTYAMLEEALRSRRSSGATSSSASSRRTAASRRRRCSPDSSGCRGGRSTYRGVDARGVRPRRRARAQAEPAPRRRARAHERAGVAPREALAGRRGAARRRHRRVYTTLNVQHVESLNDVVAQITGVVVRETVPDAVLDAADDVELVDLPPDELLERLREGKVYCPSRPSRRSRTSSARATFSRCASSRCADRRARRRRDAGVAHASTASSRPGRRPTHPGVRRREPVLGEPVRVGAAHGRRACARSGSP